MDEKNTVMIVIELYMMELASGVGEGRDVQVRVIVLDIQLPGHRDHDFKQDQRM